VILLTVLGLIAASCSAETVTSGGELPPTPEPAPTVAGIEIEVVEPEVPVEVVFVGISLQEIVEIRVKPGLEQPLVGDVPPGTNIEKMSEEFQTPDGILWWQVRAGSLQGWIQPEVAYVGPSSDVTGDILADFDTSAVFPSAQESAKVVARQVAADQGGNEVVIVRQTDAGNGSTVTADVFGFGDDKLLGFRLLIGSSSNTGFQPVSVTQFPLCAQGVTTTGACE